MLLDERPVPVTGHEPSEPLDRPTRPGGFDRAAAVELAGPAAAALVVAWLPFHMVGISAPFGELVCWMIAFVAIYGVVTWRLHGVLAMKDRLANVYVWGGGMVALVPSC